MSKLCETGDRGQRYEVQVKWKDPSAHNNQEDWEAVGWTYKSNGGALFRAIGLHPGVKERRVFDREEGVVSHDDSN